MNVVLHLVVTALLCLGAVSMLTRASWPARAPGTAIVLWQSVVLTLLLCAVGSFVAWGLAPYPGNLIESFSRAFADLVGGRLTGELDAGHLLALFVGFTATVVLAVATAASCLALSRTRRRQRQLITLVSHGDPAAPGAAVLRHSIPVAYCVPGRRPHVVISTGALDLLDREQLRAVLAHEHAHARARHDTALLPFTLLAHVLPRCRPLTQASAAVAALIEMCADDEAQRQAPRQSVAAALVQMSTHAAGPPGALSINDHATTARLTRLLTPQPRLPAGARPLAFIAGATLLSTPLSFLAFPM